MHDHLPSVGHDVLERGWLWFVILGICLVVLGMLAVGASVFVTLATVVFYGWLLILGGALEAFHSFWHRRWSGFFIDLLFGVLYFVVGLLIVLNPAVAAATLTLLIALFLMFGGLFRIVLAISIRYEHWGWLLLNGAVTLMLGILIWNQWPLSGLWVIGLFIGVEMLMAGWTLLMLGLSAKNAARLAT